MGTTSRFGLHYLAPADAPDIAGITQDLAEDADSWLARAYPVANTAARDALTSVPEGFIVRLQSDGSVQIRTDTATWANIGSGSSGGASGGVAGKWRAGSNQSLANGTDTVLAFGTTETTSAVVSRATSGGGHKFTLGQDGIYAVTCTCRIIAGAVGNRFLELRNSAQTVRYVAAGNQGGPGATTLTFAVTDQFAAGDELIVVATQSSGGTLTTQYQGSSITDGFVRLTIVQL